MSLSRIACKATNNIGLCVSRSARGKCSEYAQGSCNTHSAVIHDEGITSTYIDGNSLEKAWVLLGITLKHGAGNNRVFINDDIGNSK